MIAPRAFFGLPSILGSKAQYLVREAHFSSAGLLSCLWQVQRCCSLIRVTRFGPGGIQFPIQFSVSPSLSRLWAVAWHFCIFGRYGSLCGPRTICTHIFVFETESFDTSISLPTTEFSGSYSLEKKKIYYSCPVSNQNSRILKIFIITQIDQNKGKKFACGPSANLYFATPTPIVATWRSNRTRRWARMAPLIRTHQLGSEQTSSQVLDSASTIERKKIRQSNQQAKPQRCPGSYQRRSCHR